MTFLAVGGAGYVVDVSSFNMLRTHTFLAATDPSYARVVAVALAMVVTYLGNRLLTWRGQASDDRRREIGLFVLFNLIGLGLSVATLVVSHDVLGLTSRLDDNISANVVGLALGTLFRYWSYKTVRVSDACRCRVGLRDGRCSVPAGQQVGAWLTCAGPGGRPVRMLAGGRTETHRMTTTDAVTSRSRQMLNKVPEVTVYFWIIKILCTTVGESFADYINETLGFGLTNTTILFSRGAGHRPGVPSSGSAATSRASTGSRSC